MKFQGKREPKIGDKRTRTRFALLPMHLLESGVVVWLEKFEVDEEYVEGGWDENPHWHAVAARPLQS